MTKTERATLQNFFNKYGQIRERQDEIFNKLKDENKRINGTAWCSPQQNAKELVAAGERWAIGAMKEYTELDGQERLILELGQELANLGFWK